MDDGALIATIDPETGRRRVELRDAAGDRRPLGVAGVAWGWETSATRLLAEAALVLLGGHEPPEAMAWDLGAEVFGNPAVCPPDDGWELAVAGLDAWRRGWLRRPSSRIAIERALAGCLLQRPADLGLDPAVVADRRLRTVCVLAQEAARTGERVDLVAVQLAVEALGQGDDPGFVRALLDRAPSGPGPHWWAAQLAAAARSQPSSSSVASRRARAATSTDGCRSRSAVIPKQTPPS